MTSRFVAKRLVRTRIQMYQAPPAIVFPLHGFREERDWAVGWEPEAIYPARGTPVKGAVFAVRRSGAEEIWILVDWDVNTRVAGYVHVTPARDVTEIRIQVSGPEEGPSWVEVTYTWTGLSPAGNAFVDRQTEDYFDHWMREWEEEMEHYLRTGKKLERPLASA